MDYNNPAKFVLDGVRFYYRGESFKGQGFLTWDPKTGFHIDALLDKNFGIKDSLKPVSPIIINTKKDTFPIFLNIRNVGRAIAPRAFPVNQKHSFLPDNHLSMKLERVIFVSKRPRFNQTPSKYWSGSAEFLTTKKLEFPDHLNTHTTLGGQPFSANNSSGLYHNDEESICLSGYSPSDDKFELSWALNKNRWSRKDALRFGEAARKALSIISAQTVWIAKQKNLRDGSEIEDLHRPAEAKSVNYFFQPLLNEDMGVIECWHFNKIAFLELTGFFLKGGIHAETSWRIFHQMVDASRQKTAQGQELLLATILEAIFRTIYNRPFEEGKSDPPKSKRLEMERFRTEFFSDKWTDHCNKALELHGKLRHRNAHPDWLTSDDGGMSKGELIKSYTSLIFLSRFYGYMILGMAGFKDLEPLFPVVNFSEDQ